MTPEQRSLRARLGGLATRASGNLNIESARRAFESRFYEGIPDDLPQLERDRRAGYARKAYFARLAFKSSVARSKRRTRNARRSSNQPVGADQRSGALGLPGPHEAEPDAGGKGTGGESGIRLGAAPSVGGEPTGGSAVHDSEGWAERAHAANASNSRRSFRWRDIGLEEYHDCPYPTACPVPFPRSGYGAAILQDTPSGVVQIAEFGSFAAGKRALRALAAERFAKMLGISVASARDWIDW